MKILELYKYLPQEGKINWDLIFKGILKPFKDDLENTMQEVIWHGEGDVLTHTKMVCEELVNLSEFQILDKKTQLVLFLAALFHDIGKPSCTKIVDGKIRSFHHPTKGSLITREYFWKTLGISGNKEYQEFREAIVHLVRYHSEPTYFIEDENQDKKVIKLSLITNHTKYFNNHLLALLATADIRGRIFNEALEKELNIVEFINHCKKLECYEKPFQFKNVYTQVKYFNSDTIWYNQDLYDSTWGEIILICGLPGTGKDTYIKENFPNYAVISLDKIRRELKVKPTDNQGETINIAKEKAKEYLRNKQVFIWNATNITDLVRESQIKLFHDYNAKVRIIFLETSWESNMKRNENRKEYVDILAIEKMLRKLRMPLDNEAEYVEWICI